MFDLKHESIYKGEVTGEDDCNNIFQMTTKC